MATRRVTQPLMSQPTAEKLSSTDARFCHRCKTPLCVVLVVLLSVCGDANGHIFGGVLVKGRDPRQNEKPFRLMPEHEGSEGKRTRRSNSGGDKRIKAQLGPVVLHPDSLYYDGDDEVVAAERNDFDGDTESNFSRDGGIEIFHKTLGSLKHFVVFLRRMFRNVCQQLEKQIKLLTGIKQTEPSGPDQGQTTILIVVLSSWIIFGVIIVLIARMVNGNDPSLNASETVDSSYDSVPTANNHSEDAEQDSNVGSFEDQSSDLFCDNWLKLRQLPILGTISPQDSVIFDEKKTSLRRRKRRVPGTEALTDSNKDFCLFDDSLQSTDRSCRNQHPPEQSCCLCCVLQSGEEDGEGKTILKLISGKAVLTPILNGLQSAINQKLSERLHVFQDFTSTCTTILSDPVVSDYAMVDEVLSFQRENAGDSISPRKIRRKVVTFNITSSFLFNFYQSSKLDGKSDKLPLPKMLSMTFEKVVASIQCDMICENCCDKSDGLSSEPTTACNKQSEASTKTFHCLLNAIILKSFAQPSEGKISVEATGDGVETVSDEPVALKLKSVVSSILKEEKVDLADDEISVTLISQLDDREETNCKGNFEEGLDSLDTENPLGKGARLTCELETISIEFQCSCNFKNCSCISKSDHNGEQRVRLQMDRPLPRQTFSPSNPDRVRIVQDFVDDDNVQNQGRNKNQMIHSWTERQASTFWLLPEKSSEIFVELRMKMKLGGGCDEYFSSVSVRDLLTTNTQTLTIPLLPFGLVEDVQASQTQNNIRQILLTFQFEYLPGVDCKPSLDRMRIPPPFFTVHKTVESKLIEGLGLASAGTGKVTPSVVSSMSYTLLDQSLLNTVSNISNSNGGALDEQTKIDVALAATRDLCMQQTRGYGAYATRSTMLIRSSQKVGKGSMSLAPSNNSVSLNVKSTIRRDEKPSNSSMPAESSRPKTQAATRIADGNGLCAKYSMKNGGRLLSTLSLLKKRVAARKRFKSTNLKERRGWSKRSKKAKTTMRDNSSSGKMNLCASSSDFSTNFDGTNEIKEDDSLSGSSGSTMEGSYDLASWRGQLSMSWQSLVSATHLPVSNTAHTQQFSHENDELSSASEETFGLSVGVPDYGMMEGSSTVSLAIGEKPHGLRSYLVIETVEDCGIVRHYLIPNNAISSRQTRSQLKRMKTKLRIFMDHVFVSRKVKGGKGCSVCHKRLSSRIGRKSYVCRDCDLACHKQCYTNASVACPKSSVHSMELFRGSTILAAKRK